MTEKSLYLVFRVYILWALSSGQGPVRGPDRACAHDHHPNCTIKALRLHLLSIEPLQNTSKRHFQWKDMDRPDSDFCSPENPLVSEMKHFCKRVQEACNELKEDLTPYRNERFYRYSSIHGSNTFMWSVYKRCVFQVIETLLLNELCECHIGSRFSQTMANTATIAHYSS